MAVLLGMENQTGASSSMIRKSSHGSGGGVGSLTGDSNFLELKRQGINGLNHCFIVVGEADNTASNKKILISQLTMQVWVASRL